jgi:hypothetical protein
MNKKIRISYGFRVEDPRVLRTLERGCLTLVVYDPRQRAWLLEFPGLEVEPLWLKLELPGPEYCRWIRDFYLGRLDPITPTPRKGAGLGKYLSRLDAYLSKIKIDVVIIECRVSFGKYVEDTPLPLFVKTLKKLRRIAKTRDTAIMLFCNRGEVFKPGSWKAVEDNVDYLAVFEPAPQPGYAWIRKVGKGEVQPDARSTYVEEPDIVGEMEELIHRLEKGEEEAF